MSKHHKTEHTTEAPPALVPETHLPPPVEAPPGEAPPEEAAAAVETPPVVFPAGGDASAAPLHPTEGTPIFDVASPTGRTK